MSENIFLFTFVQKKVFAGGIIGEKHEKILNCITIYRATISYICYGGTYLELVYNGSKIN